MSDETPPVAGQVVYMGGQRYRCTDVDHHETGIWNYTLTPDPEPAEPPQPRVTRHVTVRHPAGVIDLGDGLAVDITLRRDALGSLIHARVPVMAAPPGEKCLACDGTGIDDHGHKHERAQVGTAVLVTYKTLMDGSAVDLEFDVDLDEAP